MIAFDLEGPISPQDNAYEVMKLIENGKQIFEILSKYDDILAFKGLQDYEPGDTLKLIYPFLVIHKIKKEDIKAISERAGFVRNIDKVFSWIKEKKVNACIISTSYDVHAYNIAEKLGFEKDFVACTNFEKSSGSGFNIEKWKPRILEIEEVIRKAEIGRAGEEEIFSLLDRIYFEEGLFKEINIIVIGGKRKIKALKKFAERFGESYDSIACIGDSITDFKMLDFVRKNNGLAIAFNANEYAIPYANIAVASMNAGSLIKILSAFIEQGKEQAIKLTKELEKDNDKREDKYFYIENKSKEEINSITTVSKEIRNAVRGEAGKLG